MKHRYYWIDELTELDKEIWQNLPPTLFSDLLGENGMSDRKRTDITDGWWSVELPAGQLNDAYQGTWTPDPEDELTKAIELARKNEGKCVKCGAVRRMSIHGLLDCEACGG